MSDGLHLGVIGLSPGNGHPYSWSAIFNGYDDVAMEECGFPSIPRYLERQQFPQDAIAGAQVTHVWTQDVELSAHIAKAARIRHVANDLNDMVGQVDAVLLARDDAENHLRFAKPFLEAGLPVFVDKPLALSRAAAEELFKQEQFAGQLFSCSALRYARELQLSDEQRTTLGDICHISGTVPNGWNKYSVHAIEPLLRLLPERGAVRKSCRWSSGDRVALHVGFESGVDASIMTLGEAGSPLGLRVHGVRGWLDLHFKDTFLAFRAALADFVEGIQTHSVKISRAQMLEVVEIIELGRET